MPGVILAARRMRLQASGQVWRDARHPPSDRRARVEPVPVRVRHRRCATAGGGERSNGAGDVRSDTERPVPILPSVRELLTTASSSPKSDPPAARFPPAGTRPEMDRSLREHTWLLLGAGARLVDAGVGVDAHLKAVAVGPRGFAALPHPLTHAIIRSRVRSVPGLLSKMAECDRREPR